MPSTWHHDVDITILFFGSKRCIRRAQCHQDALLQYGFLSAFSCTGSTKLAPGLTFRWWIGEMYPVHQICMQEPHCQVPSVASISLALIWYHTCRAKGIVSSEYFLKGVCPGLQQFIWRYWCNSCWSHGSCTIFCLCVNWHPRPMIDTNYTCIKGENQLEWWLCYQQVRICLCISCKPLCCNPHSLGRLHWICVRLAWLWRVDSLYLLSPMHQQDPMHSSLP